MSKLSIQDSKPVPRQFNDKVIELYPDKEHEFLMTTKQVAKGFGCCENTIRNAKREHLDELIEGKHLITSSVRNSDARGNASNLRSKAIFWTKRGIVRLGFFIRSERAKQFRDWAEDLIIDQTEKKATRKALGKGLELPEKNLPVKAEARKLFTETRMTNVCTCLVQSIHLTMWQRKDSRLLPVAYSEPQVIAYDGKVETYKEPLYDADAVRDYIIEYFEKLKYDTSKPKRLGSGRLAL